MRTLYDLVSEWAVQEWDSDMYHTIANQIFDCLNKADLLSGDFGFAVGLLMEEIDSMHHAFEYCSTAQSYETTIRERILDLISRKDFSKGAKAIELEVETTPKLKITITNEVKLRFLDLDRTGRHL